MEYVGRVPAPPLDRFIDDIYCLTGVPRHRRMNVPLMPSAHLFVNGPEQRFDTEEHSTAARCRHKRMRSSHRAIDMPD
jgi:hypothetical protein